MMSSGYSAVNKRKEESQWQLNYSHWLTEYW